MEKLKAFLQSKLARKLLAGLATLVSLFLAKRFGINVGPEEINEALELLLPVLLGAGLDEGLKALNARTAEKAGEAAVEAKPAGGLSNVIKVETK